MAGCSTKQQVVLQRGVTYLFPTWSAAVSFTTEFGLSKGSSVPYHPDTSGAFIESTFELCLDMFVPPSKRICMRSFVAVSALKKTAAQ